MIVQLTVVLPFRRIILLSHQCTNTIHIIVCLIITSYLPIVDCDCNRQGTEECNHENGECKCLNGVEGVQCDRCMADHWGFDIGEPVSYSPHLVRKLANLVNYIILSKSNFWKLDFRFFKQMEYLRSTVSVMYFTVTTITNRIE